MYIERYVNCFSTNHKQVRLDYFMTKIASICIVFNLLITVFNNHTKNLLCLVYRVIIADTEIEGSRVRFVLYRIDP